MGFIQDTIQKALKPVIEKAISDTVVAKSEELSKAAASTEAPSGSWVGYPFSGTSRRKEGYSLDFDTLRTFSVTYDVARACINHRKRQINNLEWAILPKDDKANPDKFRRNIDKLTLFFEEPFHNTDFKTFIDKIIEDLLVFDGAVLWKDKTYGDELLGLLNVDASTIKIKVAMDGLLPEPPEMAYQQIIRGEVVGQYTTEELIYKIMNPRTNTPYGLSPLESLIIGVDTALRSQMANNNMISEGTVPEGFFGLPGEWTPDQVKDFQVWFDSMLAGGRMNSRIKFMPGGKGVGYMPTKKPEDMRFMELEKFLLVKTCAMFDVQPQDIGFTENVNLNSGENQKQISNEKGLIPMANFLKMMFNHIIAKDFGITDLKFEWKGLQAIDDTFELERNKAMLQNGALTIDEWRQAQGLEPFNLETTKTPFILAAGGPVYLGEEIPTEPDNTGQSSTPDDTQEQIEEMVKWETKCINWLKLNKGIPDFKPNKLDKVAVSLITAKLVVAKNKEDIKKVFKPFKDMLKEELLVKNAIKVNNDIAKFNREKYEHTGQTT